MSGEKFKLEAKSRTIVGRKVKSLRSQGILPGNIFGKKISSESIQLNQKDFLKVFNQAGETGLIQLTVDNSQPKPVLVSMVQVHPVTDQPIHVDFHQVDLKVKVSATVPIHVIGESPAVKELGAVMLQAISEVSVEALPTDIPNHFDLDVSLLTDIGSQLTVKDLKVDSSKVSIDMSADEPIIIIQEAKAEEVEETPQEVEALAEGAEQEKTEEKSEEKAQ